MPLVRRFRGRRVTKTRRRDGWVWVRLAAVPKDDLLPEWIRVTTAEYRAGRTCTYQPAVLHVRVGERHDRDH